jgi:sugar phosphate isomerase/epimerase
MTSRRAFLTLAGAAAASAAGKKFSQPLGLQIYSLRRQAQKDLPGTLTLIRKLGFRELEIGGFYGRTPAEFKRMLSDHGLAAVSMGAGWDQLSKAANEAADQARTVGAQYVTCSQIPRKGRLTLENTTRAADLFNGWGESLAQAGLQFCYHTHGYEFVEGPDGTLFDTLARLMDPKVANFEMDVFWIVFGNEDPAKMLERYSGRFPLMHVKDIRNGEPRTFNPGTVREEASVPLGMGEVDWPPVLRAAEKHGVRKYFIEEEHPNALAQIQQSMEYLKNLRL